LDAEYQIRERLLGLLGGRLNAYFPASPIHHKALWVSAVFENLRNSVSSGSEDAIEIACIFIENDPTWLPFGKLIKSNLARALKKNVPKITAANRKRIIATTLRLLQENHSPRELEDYAKLVKKFPSSEYVSLVSAAALSSEKACHIRGYLNETL
jgi:hypothetical protein